MNPFFAMTIDPGLVTIILAVIACINLYLTNKAKNAAEKSVGDIKEVHTLTNNTNTELRAEIKSGNEKIAALTNIIGEQQKSAALATQASVSAASTASDKAANVARETMLKAQHPTALASPSTAPVAVKVVNPPGTPVPVLPVEKKSKE